MSAIQRNLLIGVAALAAGLGVGGGAGYFLTRNTGSQALPPVQQVNPLPAKAEKVTEFDSSSAAYTVTRATGAYLAPDADAPQFYQVAAGTPIQAIETSRDGKWVVTQTQDGQAAFLPTEALGPYAPPPPEDLTGPAKVVDTATLTVNGQRLSLAGVTGETGAYARELQTLINAKGKTVHCRRADSHYVCDLPGVGDIARATLFNGAARPAGDASADYQQQAAAAQAAHKGVWK